VKTIIYCRRARNGTEAELSDLRRIVENRGDTLIATFADDPAILRKGRYAGWRGLVASLDQADQVMIGSVGDLPGRTVQDLLKILSILNEHDVGLRLHREGINTDGGSAATLALTTAFRAIKRSEAIKRGIARARMAGKGIGRPQVPNRVRQQIQTALAIGEGVRQCARRYKVSSGTVINIRRSMNAEVHRLAAA
jgi:DNA invertase Pin-like site-specific DNA recombinase